MMLRKILLRMIMAVTALHAGEDELDLDPQKSPRNSRVLTHQKVSWDDLSDEVVLQIVREAVWDEIEWDKVEKWDTADGLPPWHWGWGSTLDHTTYQALRLLDKRTWTITQDKTLYNPDPPVLKFVYNPCVYDRVTLSIYKAMGNLDDFIQKHNPSPFHNLQGLKDVAEAFRCAVNYYRFFCIPYVLSGHHLQTLLENIERAIGWHFLTKEMGLRYAPAVAWRAELNNLAPNSLDISDYSAALKVMLDLYHFTQDLMPRVTLDDLLAKGRTRIEPRLQENTPFAIQHYQNDYNKCENYTAMMDKGMRVFEQKFSVPFPRETLPPLPERKQRKKR